MSYLVSYASFPASVFSLTTSPRVTLPLASVTDVLSTVLSDFTTTTATTSIHSYPTSPLSSAATTDEPTASTTPTVSSSTSPASSTASSSPGLSAPAKVGLGIGIPLGIIVIALLVAGGYFWGRRARKQDVKTPATPQDAPQELNGRQWRGAELPTKSNKAEMPVTNETVEISGSERDPAELWAHDVGQR